MKFGKAGCDKIKKEDIGFIGDAFNVILCIWY